MRSFRMTCCCGNCIHVELKERKYEDGLFLDRDAKNAICKCPLPSSVKSKERNEVNIDDDGTHCPCFAPIVDKED